MRVYHDATGKIIYTVNSLPGFEPESLGGESYVETSLEIIDTSAYAVLGGVLVVVSAASPELRLQAEAETNALIGRSRALFLTNIPFQETTYVTKRAEAVELLAMAAEPTDPTIFPFLYAEVGITGATITDVAQVVLNLSYQWTLLGSNMEKLRMAASVQFTTAQTRDEVTAAKDTFMAGLGALLASVGRSITEVSL